VRLVLDVNILVRANDRTAGLARELLRELLRQRWTILISGEMLVELARVLRYPRLRARYNLTEADLICTVDADFYEPAITRFLSQAGIKVLDDVALMQMLRASASEESSGFPLRPVAILPRGSVYIDPYCYAL